MDKAQSAEAAIESAETAPETGAQEQVQEPSFQDTLLALAQEEGMIPKAEVAEPPKEEKQPEVEVQPEVVPPAEGEDQGEDTLGEIPEEEPEEEQKPAAKGDPWPDSAKVRVAEETEKRKRANDRADRAERELTEVKARIADLERAAAPAPVAVPTRQNPLIDIQDETSLNRLKETYKEIVAINRDEVDEEGLIPIVVATDKDGKPVTQKYTPEQLRILQVRAESVLRDDIPQRAAYLAERAEADARATTFYPDLKNADHGFTKMVNEMTTNVLSGRAMSDPEVKFWAANAVYGFLKRKEEAQASNGKTEGSSVKKIAESARTKLAPTAPRNRSVPTVTKSSADLARTEQNFLKNKRDPQAQEAYVASLLSQRGQTKRVQPVSE